MHIGLSKLGPSSTVARMLTVNVLMAFSTSSSWFGLVDGASVTGDVVLLARQGPTRMSPTTLDTVLAYLPEVLERSLDLLDKTVMAEMNFSSNSVRQSGRSSSIPNTFRHVQELLGSTPEAKLISFTSFIQTRALSMLQNEFKLSDGELQEVINIMPLMIERDDDDDVTMSAEVNNDDEPVAKQGQPPPSPPPPPPIPWSPLMCPYPSKVLCPPGDPYRTFDGRCNNPLFPLWGAAHQPFVRFLPPQYADGIGAPRASVSRNPLPSPRLVSSTVHWDYDRPSAALSLLLVPLGQFIDHDMSRTAISKLTTNDISVSIAGNGLIHPNMKDVDCGDDGCLTEGLENKECLPIQIPVNDTDFGGKKPCLMFVRSMEAPNAECLPGPREQLNQITAFLDASVIYGSSFEEATFLRDDDPARGRLKVQRHPAGKHYKPLPPRNPKLRKSCGDLLKQCFKAGDGRVNEFAGTTTQHAIWLREHNRIEEQLWSMNPHWNGEMLFQETRKIISAIWQYIIYKEYLPIIIGSRMMDMYRLTLVEEGFWNEYKVHVNPGIANSFATAAMRFGHSQLEGLLRTRDINYAVSKSMPLSTQLMHPEFMYDHPTVGLDGMLRGLIGGSVQTRDPFITKQVTRHLFASDPVHGIGEDLMSLNIQRGRDHGLPGYNFFREWCGLKRASHFSDLVSELSAEVVHRFELLYETVDDIDLWPAGISETASHGSLLGPTFTCILARQFANLKYGDRFWFENNQQNPSPFTSDQLQSIRQVKYSKIICANSDSVTTIQPNVLYHPLSILQQTLGETKEPDGYGHLYASGANERVPCEQIPEMDLRPWRELTPSVVPPLPPPSQFDNILPTSPPSSRRSSSGRRRRRKVLRVFVQEQDESEEEREQLELSEETHVAEPLPVARTSEGDDYEMPIEQLSSEVDENHAENYTAFREVQRQFYRQQQSTNLTADLALPTDSARLYV